jgi:hypothetical protein
LREMEISPASSSSSSSASPTIMRPVDLVAFAFCPRTGTSTADARGFFAGPPSFAPSSPTSQATAFRTSSDATFELHNRFSTFFNGWSDPEASSWACVLANCSTTALGRRSGFLLNRRCLRRFVNR